MNSSDPEYRGPPSTGLRPRVGLLGGTFDPVHVGHLGMAQSALEAFALDRVLLIPSAVPPHKRTVRITDAHHRLAMLRLAVKGLPRLEISTVELDRGGISYTVETVALLRKRHPEWDCWLLIGMDSLRELHLWHRVEELLSSCTIATLERPGVDRPVEVVPGVSPEWSRLLLRNVSVGRPADVSSSGIRSRIAESETIRYLVPPAVEAYILSHDLYASHPALNPSLRRTPINALELARTAAQALDERKGSSIRILDVRSISPVTDYVVIASASSTPHLKALQGAVSKRLREQSGPPTHRTSGDPLSAWIVMDFFDVIVHLFLPEAREYYDIENLWDQGAEVPWE